MPVLCILGTSILTLTGERASRYLDVRKAITSFPEALKDLEKRIDRMENNFEGMGEMLRQTLPHQLRELVKTFESVSKDEFTYFFEEDIVPIQARLNQAALSLNF